MVYQKVTSIDAEGGNYVIVAPTKDNTWIPFGQFKDPDKTYGYMEGEPVEIADGFITSDVSNHIMTLTPTEKVSLCNVRMASSSIRVVRLTVSTSVLPYPRVGIGALLTTMTVRHLM